MNLLSQLEAMIETRHNVSVGIEKLVNLQGQSVAVATTKQQNDRHQDYGGLFPSSSHLCPITRSIGGLKQWKRIENRLRRTQKIFFQSFLWFLIVICNYLMLYKNCRFPLKWAIANLKAVQTVKRTRHPTPLSNRKALEFHFWKKFACALWFGLNNPLVKHVLHMTF